MSKQPQAKQVLAIVEKIGTKIAIANGGKSLENLLDNHLVQLLTLLGFPEASVRNKVIEVLSNTVNKRVKLESTTIKLPFGKILELFQKEISNSFIKNFAVIYLDMGFPQLSPSEMTEYLPTFFQVLPLLNSNPSDNTSVSNKQHQAMFLRFIVEAVCNLTYPEKEEDALEKFQEIRNCGTSTLDIFIDFAIDFMLYKPSQKSVGSMQTIYPNGLNVIKIKRILGSRETIEAQELQKRKMNLLEFFTKSACFSENQQFLVLVIGMSQQESTDQLGSRCEVLIKKLSPDYEEPTFIQKLFSIYLGDSSNGISQASLPLKYKILSYLCKSTLAANHFPQTHLVLMDSLFSEYAGMKLRGFGMQFFMWVIQEGTAIEQEYGSEVFRSILSNISRLSSSTNSSTFSMNEIAMLKENMYTALGSFARKFPHFVMDRFDLVERYFDAIAFEDTRIRVAILQGLSNLIYAFKVNFMNNSEEETRAVRVRFENLFYSWVVERNTGLSDLLTGKSTHQNMQLSAKSAVNSAVLRCANSLFPFDNVVSRFLCLFCTAGGFGSGDNVSLSHQIREECLKGTDLDKFTKARQLDHWVINKKGSDSSESSEENVNKLPMFLTVKFSFPTFKSVVGYIFDFMTKFDPAITKSNTMPALNKIVAPSAHSAMIKFCFDCLAEECKLQNVSMLERIEKMSQEMLDDNVKDDFEKFLYVIEKSFDDKVLLYSGTTSNATELLLEASETLLRLLLSLKDKPDYVKYISRRFSFLLDEKGPFLFDLMLGSYNDIAREKFSKFIALLFIFIRQDPEKSSQCEKLIGIWKDYIEKQFGNANTMSDHKGEVCALGSILTLGSIISLNYASQSSSSTEPYLLDAFKLILSILSKIPLTNLREPLHQACYLAVGEMGYSGVLQDYFANYFTPTIDELQFEVSATLPSKEINSMDDLVTLFVKLVERYASSTRQKNSSTTNEKILERLIITVGKVCVGSNKNNDPKVADHVAAIITVLFQLNNVKTTSIPTTGTGGSSNSSEMTATAPQAAFDENISFTVGESLALIGGGLKHCELAKDDPYFVIYNQKNAFSSDEEETEHYDGNLRTVLSRLVRECVLNPKKIVRQASSIWLLAVTKYSGQSNALFKKYIKEVQRAFSLLVTENNEVTSEVAGKGLGYVYEMAENTDRKQLVDSLMNYLIGNKKPQNLAIIEEPEELMLFPAGEEHQKGGKNAPTLSTYKELVDAATDIGRPEMIYQLLAVSNHNAIWNAKKAYAFSMTSILGNLSGTSLLEDKEFEKSLPQLVPKLFRFLFDPNPTISGSMKEMWKSLFGSENDKTKQNMIISKYLPRIMKELLNGLNQELWRIREACCYAICELIGGSSSKTFEEMAPFIKDSFQKVWRVTDDVKDTCRKAAQSALTKLSNFVIKACNPTYTSKRENVSRALAIAIPLLLHEGLIFPFKDVVHSSLATLKEVVHVSTHYIRPHIHEIVSTLLQQMSVLEPAQFNYIQMNAAEYGISVEQLESLRLSAMSRGGPLSEIIMDCERHVDESVLQTLVPSLLEVLQVGVGLQTRAHCAKFIASLGKFHGRYLKDFVNPLDVAIMSAIRQTESMAEKKELATALSQVVKNGKVSEAKRVLVEILNMYTQEGEENENENSADELRMMSALILEQISKNCTILLKRFYDIALPIMFIARHDKSERVRKMWDSVWEESTNTSVKSTLEIHIKVIVDRCIQLLGHPTWELKRQGGSALQEVASALGILLNEKPQEREQMITALLNSITGRLWEGKIVLLKALGSVCETFVSKENQQVSQEMKILDILQKECKKKDVDYRLEALKAYHSAVKNAHFAKFITQEIYETSKSFFLEEMSNMEKEEQEEIKVENENKIAMVNDDKTHYQEKMKRDIKSSKRETSCVQIIHILSYLIPATSQVEQRRKAVDWILDELLAPRLVQYLTPNINNALLTALLQFVKLRIALKAEDPSVLDLTEQKRVFELAIFNLDPNNRQIHVRPNAFNTLKDLMTQLADNNLLLDETKQFIRQQLNEDFLKRVLEPLLHDQIQNFANTKL
ncbi:hypothetical protein NAEGRDRAFT_57411 [Naegleria gruberi]|uniref:Uncharacterized protein n=1 Tax=Naegleria gruberi TaxID=5762 RepID=D2V7S9_NAEGR|nr:uncharacterized protein NAEGRDRAFT_57411 [Naegleria gruberi]EFC46924.1 hypothetical protein NAEGRDRAFT_57411 [Naegleria gruberi]|eukprot:XP_002679668.1 hypothetical protein NAEGRDRAFT_57411 [Naegleria gruberi strain NEG-M]